MLGFSFAGEHSSNYGLVMKSRKRPILPKRRIVREELPNRHGSIDFEVDTFEDRIIEVDCSFVENSIQNIRQKARQLAGWLNKTGDLIFDDEPNIKYIGKISNQIDLTTTARVGRFTLIFLCEPFAYGVSQNAIQFTTSTFNIENKGTWESFPTLIITANSSQVSLTNQHTAEQFVINGLSTGDVIEIDNKNMIVKINNINGLNKFSGDFIKLLPGINSIQVSGHSSIEFRWYDTYL